ncbi:hypothetical protein JAO29_11945 [Edaphobacter sp. HDX4]|uniref:hypothetical protein n=1 Tax=Edaphobacter sp. HDX4 TaxID=2794064 RepID=UPI002FE5EB36
MRRILLPLILLATSSAAEGQDGFVNDFASKWEARATKTQAAQPKWAVPMFSPFPVLAQVFRSDFTRQRTSAGETDWHFGAGKGFNLIPFANTQIDILVPGWVMHGGNGQQDGFGDMTLLGKYRFLSKTEKQGNYILSGALAWTIPTGSYKNGSASSVLHPSVIGGKGFGKLALFSSLGGGLPTSHSATSGRTVQWNSVAQYKIGKYFSPELEINTTRYFGGTRDGKTQTFLSPSIIVGKLPIRRVEGSRLGITVGAGFQTAVTNFHTYNNAFSTSVRFVF